MIWTKAWHRVAFYPYQSAVSNVADGEAAIHELEDVVKLVNRTWERRAEIQPQFDERRRPVPMEACKLLPHANRKACGQPTCFVFAKLTVGQLDLEACLVLQELQYTQRLAQLEQRLAREIPAIGQRE